MFDQYLLPVTTAAMVFPALALVLLVPFSFVAYRRRGRLGWLRSLVFFSFVYFAAAAFLLTLMPLPRNPQMVCATFPGAAHPQYALGNFVVDFMKETHGRQGVAMVLGNPSLYQVMFNVAMLAPLGIFLRYYAGRSLATTAAAGLGTSLLFELTQGTGVWGLYPCPYRLADVDDLFLNTTGAALGWLLAGKLLRILPDLRVLDERARRERGVVFGRRLWAFAFDLVVSALASVAMAVAGTVLGFSTETAVAAAPFVTVVIWFVLVPRFTDGATVGKRLMRITLVGRAGAPPAIRALLVRYLELLVLAALMGGLIVSSGSARVTVLLLCGLALPLAIVSAFVVLLRRDSRGVHELVSGVHNVCRAGTVRRWAPRHRRDWRQVPAA